MKNINQAIENALRDQRFRDYLYGKFGRFHMLERDALIAVFERYTQRQLQIADSSQALICQDINQDILKLALDEIDADTRIREARSESFREELEDACDIIPEEEFDRERLKVNGRLVVYDNFRKFVPPDIMTTLRELHVKGNFEMSLLLMLLELERTGASSQQWSMPSDWFKASFEQFPGFAIIGFSSPLNVSRAYKAYTDLHLDGDTSSGFKFFSVNESDKLFGSQGKFSSQKCIEMIQEQQAKSDSGVLITINPPFIEGILTDAASSTIEIMKTFEDSDQTVTILFTGPGWSDAEYVQILDSAKCAGLVKKIMASQFHRYEDSNKEFKKSAIIAMTR